MRATGGELYQVTGRVTDLVSTNLLEGCAGTIRFGHYVCQLSPHGCQRRLMRWFDLLSWKQLLGAMSKICSVPVIVVT